MRTSYTDDLQCKDLPFRHRHSYRCDQGHSLVWTRIQHWRRMVWCPDCQDWRDWSATPVIRECFYDASLRVGSASEMLVYGLRSAWAYHQVSRMRDQYLESDGYDEREFKRLGYMEIYLAALDDTETWFASLDSGYPELFIKADSPRDAYDMASRSALALEA